MIKFENVIFWYTEDYINPFYPQKMTKKVSTLLLSLFFMMCFTVSYGQPAPGLPDPIELPIDGGIVFLLISGLVFGIHKIKNN